MLSQPTQTGAALAAGMHDADAGALAAAGTFGAVLRASPEFTALVAADAALSADPDATAAIKAFGDLRSDLRAEIAMGFLNDDQRAELDRLQTAMLAVPSVATYVAATASFQAVCRETAAVISAQIGLDLPANCRSGGCCG